MAAAVASALRPRLRPEVKAALPAPSCGRRVPHRCSHTRGQGRDHCSSHHPGLMLLTPGKLLTPSPVAHLLIRGLQPGAPPFLQPLASHTLTAGGALVTWPLRGDRPVCRGQVASSHGNVHLRRLSETQRGARPPTLVSPACTWWRLLPFHRPPARRPPTERPSLKTRRRRPTDASASGCPPSGHCNTQDGTQLPGRVTGTHAAPSRRSGPDTRVQQPDQ